MPRTTKLPPIHPGEILREEFLGPLGLSASRFADHLGVPPNRITHILNAERAITADTALRLGKALGTTARFWMNLQVLYDLEVVERSEGAKIERTVAPLPELAVA